MITALEWHSLVWKIFEVQVTLPFQVSLNIALGCLAPISSSNQCSGSSYIRSYALYVQRHWSHSYVTCTPDMMGRTAGIWAWLREEIHNHTQIWTRGNDFTWFALHLPPKMTKMDTSWTHQTSLTCGSCLEILSLMPGMEHRRKHDCCEKTWLRAWKHGHKGT